jgi:hypothetical protein
MFIWPYDHIGLQSPSHVHTFYIIYISLISIYFSKNFSCIYPRVSFAIITYSFLLCAIIFLNSWFDCYHRVVRWCPFCLFYFFLFFPYPVFSVFCSGFVVLVGFPLQCRFSVLVDSQDLFQSLMLKPNKLTQLSR